MGLLGFFIDIILLAALALGVDSASNRNEYLEYLLWHKGGWYVGLTTLPPTCADCPGILGVYNSWGPKGLCRPA